MPRVTALKRHRHEGVAVELDGKPWRVLPADVVLQAGLAVGLEADRARLRRVSRSLRRHAALRAAAQAVRGRDLSAAALDARLVQRGIPAGHRSETLATLERAGIIDDERVAEARACV